MYECERINQELNNYYSFASSILNFLQKNLAQFHKALVTYSIVLKHLHTKSTNLLNKTDFNHQLTKDLYHAFSSFIQTFDNEYHQLEQRARFLKITQLTIQKLKQQINSSINSKQKQKLHNYTYRIIRLNRYKKRQYLYRLIQQIHKHDQLTLTWKDNLDKISSQTTNILWKLFSYSPYKFDIKPIQTPSISRSTINLPCIENNKTNDQISSSPIELGCGDRLHSKSLKQQISNSNNALILSIDSKENRSLYSTDMDETIIEKNQLDDDLVDDEDERWTNLVKQNQIPWKQTATTLSISSDQSNDDSENIIQRHKRIIKTLNSLHLSDISYTTDYYSQNESD